MSKKPLDLKDTQLIDFDTIKEAWSTLRLADGFYLRIKTNVVKVRKHPTAKTPEGYPVYNVATNQTIGVFSADEISKMKEFKDLR